MIKKPLTALVAAIALLGLAACGGNDESADAGETQTAADGEEFNDADIAFATDMIPHHAQALTMVDMTQGRELDPEVASLVEDIRAAQAPEIEQMTEWLASWDQPVPETMRDHSNAHGDDSMDMDSDMPGMMSQEEMADLEAARGGEFQQMWLEMMIEHHEGAVEMAQSEVDQGTFDPAIKLAEQIEDSQEQEIETMHDLLDS